MRKLLVVAFISSMGFSAMAQNIDFDLPGKTAPGKDTEVNYESGPSHVPRAIPKHSATESPSPSVPVMGRRLLAVTGAKPM